MSFNASKNIIIEQNKPLSESAIWEMQRQYFDKEGIHAWVNQVPFYITSNPFIANIYARLVLGFIRDTLAKNPDAVKHPFYILELGTGSGRFSYYCIKTICEQLEVLHRKDIKICYVMSDFTTNNVAYWETHHALKPFVDAGLIDFAIYNMEAEEPIHLVKKNISLDKKVLQNPLIVFANYIFDTVTQDTFSVSDGKLYELAINLSTSSSNMKDGSPINMEEVSVEHNKNEIQDGYYKNDCLDAILEEYKNKLSDTNFLFPIGSMRAIQYLEKLSNNKLLIISTDKGYNTLESLDHLHYPAISFHGSFSLMVNFHALSLFFKKRGGDAFLQEARKGIKTAVFASGMQLKDYPETTLLIEEHVEGFSPGDYFILHTRMSEAFQECDLATLASHMQLAYWDPHMYLKMTNYIISKIEDEDRDTISFMASNMPKMAKNYYYMPQSPCVLFDIGVFFHVAKIYDQAVQYYLQAKDYMGEQFSLYYNLALCQHHIGDNAAALENFKRAQKIDPDSSETKQWVEFLMNNA